MNNMILNFCGGGASLNFQVVGNPQPENPKENTVWVDTDVEITGWDFRATQPETAQEGMVWFPTATYSAVEFNALKKNCVMVYPLSAKQYISGAWVTKTAKIYQDGAWSNWYRYILEAGDQYADFTGGWIGVSELAPYKDGRTLRAPTVSTGNDVVTLSMPGKSEGSYRTVKMIDVSMFNTAEICVDSFAISSGMVMLFLIDKTNAIITTSSAASIFVNTGAETGPKTVALDISSVVGNYYIGVCMASYADNTSTVKISGIRLM